MSLLMNGPKTINIRVTVLPKSSKSEIVEEQEGYFKIKLKSAPVKGEANTELIKILAKKYNVSKSRIGIVKGLKNKTKFVNIYLS